MAAHRYWRAVALEAYDSGDLELSCFHLLDAEGTRVDASATLTASVAPATGSVANLQDDDLSTAARWPVQSVAALVLTWDFGVSSTDVSDIRLAGDSEVRFPLIAKIQYSDDASVWVNLFVASGIEYPAPGAKTSSVSIGTWSRADKASFIGVDRAGTTSFSSATPGFIRGNNPYPGGTRQLEFVLSGSANKYVGVVRSALDSSSAAISSGQSNLVIPSSGNIYKLGDYYSYSPAFAPGSVIGMTLDAAGDLTFYKDGVSQGVAYTEVSADSVPCADTGGSAFSSCLLRTNSFAYPIVGASAWASDTIQVAANLVRGRAASTGPITVGTGPAIIYGIQQLQEPVRLGVESGAVKDFITGVLGKGIGQVRGTVKKKGTPANTPVYCKVRLIREKDGLQMREVWSHPVTGAYSFDYIDEMQMWTVLSYDHTGAFRAVVASGLTLENNGVKLMR